MEFGSGAGVLGAEVDGDAEVVGGGPSQDAMSSASFFRFRASMEADWGELSLEEASKTRRNLWVTAGMSTVCCTQRKAVSSVGILYNVSSLVDE